MSAQSRRWRTGWPCRPAGRRSRGSCPGCGGSAALWCTVALKRKTCSPRTGAARSGSGTRSGHNAVSRSRFPARATRPPGSSAVGVEGPQRQDVQPDRVRSSTRSNRSSIFPPERKSRVAAVFGLIDGVGVAESADALLGSVQGEAQARGVDPPVADLAQALCSRLTRQGICALGQALRIRYLSKAVALLGEPDPAARA
jgi:hypothetical protein